MREEGREAEQAAPKETWETPQLRILPVPTKTQSGFFRKANREDDFYRLS